MDASLGIGSVDEGTVATLDLLAGRYALGDVVGRGRSAVHVARDTRLGRDVAVKRVALASGPEEVDDVQARALREARAAARMTSPHVVAVYDVVQERDALWLVMELVRAPSLEALVRQRGPLDPALAACIGRGVLDGLDAAHGVGVVHRDVKPANVLVGTGDGAVGGCPGVTVKLTDFGVAALRDESGLTLPGLVVGSPSYMAPEQASAGDVGPAADLWALGALLYFAQEGVAPYAGDTALATASAVVHGRPRPMRNPGPLTPVVERLMVKDPAARPSAAEVRRALQAVSSGAAADLDATIASSYEGEITVAGAAGPGTLTRVDRPNARARRSRRRALLAAAAVAAALGGLGTQLLGSDPGTPGPSPADAEPTGAADTTIAPTPAEAPAPAAQVSDVGASAEPPAEDVAPPDAGAPGNSENGNGNANGQDNGDANGQREQAPETTVPSTTVPDDPAVTTPPSTEPEAPPTTVPTSGEADATTG